MKFSSTIFIVGGFILLNLLIFLLPYYVNGYESPVGWDTPVYIRHMKVIEKYGFLYFFQYSNGINFYSVLAYLVSSIFQLSFMTTETIFPLLVGLGFPLVNFLVIRKLYRSWKLELLVLTLSIVNYNVMRMVVDLHRNLLCLLCIQVALFIFLPDILKNHSKKRIGIFIILIVLGGLSQIETFILATTTLSILFAFFLWQRELPRAKLSLLLAIAPLLLVILFMSPFLEVFLQKAVYFNPTYGFSYEAYVATSSDYFSYLGFLLIPLYILGLGACLQRYLKNREENLIFTILLWNLLVLTGSLLPWLAIKIQGWRVLLLTTVPLSATIGFAKFTRFITAFELHLSGLKTRLGYSLLVFVLIASVLSTAMYFAEGVTTYYKPWISNDNLKKLTWISSYIDQDKPNIFVLYFNFGEWTKGVADVRKGWVAAIVSPNCQVYFGKVISLLYLTPTKSDNPYINQTAYSYWSEIFKNQQTLRGYAIYLIDDWYTLTLDSNYVTEIYPGVFQVKESSIEQPYLVPTFLSAYTDSYNRTKNSYGLRNNWTRDWAQSEYILESYEDPFFKTINDPTYFQVSFLVPLSDEVNYTLKIRWFDYSSSYAPTALYIDGMQIASIYYNDTYLPQTLEIHLSKLSREWHFITLEISGHKDKVHFISLDYIEVVAEK